MPNYYCRVAQRPRPSSRTVRIRVQVREDGLRLDKIVLSAEKYLQVSPQDKNDATIRPQLREGG